MVKSNTNNGATMNITAADKLDTVREAYAHAIGSTVHTDFGPVRLDYFGLRVGKIVAVVHIDTEHAFGHIEMHLDDFLAAYY
jgi:hypothetical protein